MKVSAFALALFLACVAPVNAAILVNTGTPNNDSAWSFFRGQYFAGEVTIGAATTITGVEGYLSNENGRPSGSVLVALYTDGGNIPGAVLFSTRIDLPSGSPLNWYGVASGLDWAVNPGNYWLAFEPNGNIDGSMPGTAPLPLNEYAQGSYALGPNGAYYDCGANCRDFLGIGIRAFGEVTAPEPDMVTLTSLGFIGLAVARRRKLSGIDRRG